MTEEAANPIGDALDLTDERPEHGRLEPTTKGLDREGVRKWLAFGLLGMLALVIAGWTLLSSLQSGAEAARTDQIFQTVFAGILGLTGSATGFYFGSRDR